MDSGSATEVLVMDEFPGYFPEGHCPVGGVTDRGDFHSPFRSRGFQIDSARKLCKSYGYSHVAQVFTDTATKGSTQVHGLHYWKGSGGRATIILGGSFGLLRSRQLSDTPGTDPYMLRFDSLSQLGPAWTGFPSADPGSDTGASFLFGCFAEFGDSLYYCNGADWPIRIDDLHSLFAKSATLAPYYRAMGVFHPGLDNLSDLQIGLALYPGKRSAAESGYNVTTYGLYVASVVSKFGESPPRVIGTPHVNEYLGSGGFPLVYVDWPDFDTHILGVRLYRTPLGSATPQLVTEMRRPSPYFIDTVADSGLGYALPYDTGLPSNFRLLATFQERLFGVGGYGRPNRVACSKAGYPDVWPPTFEIPLGSDLGTRMITQLRMVNGDFYLFLDRGILRLVGSSPENYTFRMHNDFVGCIAPRTLFPWQDGVVFLSRDGLYFFNGTELRPLGLTGPGWEALGVLPWRLACGAVSHDRYYLSYRDDTSAKWEDEVLNPVAGTVPNRTLVVNMRNGAVGIIDDWAFGQSTPYESSEALVLSFPG